MENSSRSPGAWSSSPRTRWDSANPPTHTDTFRKSEPTGKSSFFLWCCDHHHTWHWTKIAGVAWWCYYQVVVERSGAVEFLESVGKKVRSHILWRASPVFFCFTSSNLLVLLSLLPALRRSKISPSKTCMTGWNGNVKNQEIIIIIQEISNRTHWTDPEKTWVSNSSIVIYWTVRPLGFGPNINFWWTWTKSKSHGGLVPPMLCRLGSLGQFKTPRRCRSRYTKRILSNRSQPPICCNRLRWSIHHRKIRDLKPCWIGWRLSPRDFYLNFVVCQVAQTLGPLFYPYHLLGNQTSCQ